MGAARSSALQSDGREESTPETFKCVVPSETARSLKSTSPTVVDTTPLELLPQNQSLINMKTSAKLHLFKAMM